jgi:hypothetical protein
MKGKIFKSSEIISILSKQKTQFREVIKPYPVLSDDKSYWEFKGVRWAGEKSSYAKNFGDNARPEIPDLCPYQVGQKIFVKEVFSHSNQRWCDKTMFYKASHGNRIQNTFSVANREDKWRSPATMHEEHSRLTMQIKEIRVERLADISEEDAIAEGSEPVFFPPDGGCYPLIQGFQEFWNSTHKKPEEKFEANPWVWCVSFKVINN